MKKRRREILVGAVLGAVLLGLIVELSGYQPFQQAIDGWWGRSYPGTTSVPATVSGNSEIHQDATDSLDQIGAAASENPLVFTDVEGAMSEANWEDGVFPSGRGPSPEESTASSGRSLTPDLVPVNWQLHRIVYSESMVPHKMRLDYTVVWNGASSVEVSVDDTGPPFGTGALQQVVSAESLKGRRLRYEATLRTRSLKNAGYAQAFVRAETRDGVVVAFDNLPKGVLRGDTDWTQRVIIVDIPESAAVVFWGAFMVGPGRMWVDSANLTLARPEMTVTAAPYGRSNKNPPAESLFQILESPANGNFETGVEVGESSYVTSMLPLR